MCPLMVYAVLDYAGWATRAVVSGPFLKGAALLLVGAE